MSSSLLLISIIINAFITGLVYRNYLFELYSLRDKFSKFHLHLLILSFVIINIALNFFIIVPIINTAFSFLFIFIISFALFKHSSKQYILNNCIFIFYFIVVDLATVLLYSSFRLITLSESMYQAKDFFITGILYNFIILITHMKLIGYMYNFQLNTLKTKQLCVFVFAALFEIALLSYILNLIHFSTSGLIFIFILAGFIILNLSILHLFSLIEQQNTAEKNLLIARKQIADTVTYYKKAEEKHLKSRRLYHDINRHINVIQTLMISNTEESTQYFAELKQEIETLNQKFWCSNQILNVLVNDRLELCSIKNIQLEPLIQDINLDFMSSLDITILFSNLLDNAIEANTNVQNPYIKVELYHIKQYILINIKNTYINQIVQHQSGLKSTKENHFGIGLNNVKEVVTRYNGSINITYDQLFCVEITIPISNN